MNSGAFWWVVIGGAIGLAIHYYEPPGSWAGFVYPDRNNLLTDIKIGAFNSLEECRDAALARIETVSSVGTADYECGYKCDGGSSGGVCEKTKH